MVRVEFRWVYVDMNSVIPRLQFFIRLTSTYREGEEWIFLWNGDFRIQSRDSWRFLSMVYANELFYRLQFGEERSTTLYADLNPWLVEEIEKARGGGDLSFNIGLYVSSFNVRGAMSPSEVFIRMATVERINVVDPRSGIETITIPRSLWIERYLPELGYRRIRLLEVPLLEPIPSELKDAPDLLDSAWRQFNLGEYGVVLNDCRKAVEAVRNWFYRRGWKKEKKIDDRQVEIPDFCKLVQSESLARYLEDMYEGIYGFTSIGSHYGRPVSRPEAEYALMATYSLVNYIVRLALKAQ